MTDQNTHEAKQQRQVVRDFAHWLTVARTMVHNNFVGDENELQHMTIQAAHSMMLEYKLGAIEESLSEIKASLNSDKD